MPRFLAAFPVVLSLGACATPLPTATPEELDAATARVIETSLQLRGIGRACEGAGGDVAAQARQAEAAWRERHRHLLVNAGARHAATLASVPGPDGEAQRVLPAVKLRVETERLGRDRVAGAARNTAELAAQCAWELEQFANGVRDLLPQADALPGLRVLALPAGVSASGPAVAAASTPDLDPPAAGRDLVAQYRTGMSFAQVDKLLVQKRCPRAAVLSVFANDTQERYVALCESGRRYVVRCEFRNCVSE